MTVRDLFNLFHQWCLDNCAPRTADFYREQMAMLLRNAGHLPAEEARPHHILGERQTWHRVLAAQRLYRWAETQGLPFTNHFAAVTRPRRGARRGILARADLVRLFRGAAPDFRQLLLVAKETAARPQEYRVFTWEHIVYTDGVSWDRCLERGDACFVLSEFKGRKMRRDGNVSRVVPISCRLGRLLARMGRVRERTGTIFLTGRGRTWSTNTLRCRMRRLRIGLKLSGTMQSEPVVMYTLRHTTATAWATAGMSTNVLQALLGHAHIRMTQRYVHLGRRQIMDAWKRWKNGRFGVEGM